MNEQDGLDVGISVRAEGEEVAKQVADGLVALRTQLKALASDAKESAEIQRAAAKQAQDELKASARNIADTRRQFREAERAAEQARVAEQRAIEQQVTNDIRRATREIAEERKIARASERAALKADADERRAINQQVTNDIRRATREIAAEQKAARAVERAAAKQARDEQLAAARQISADRKRASDIERQIAKDEAIARKAATDAARVLAREESARSAAAAKASREQAAAQRASAKAVNEQRIAWVGLGEAVIAAAVAFAGFQAFRLLISEGLKFNQVIETANLGIASLITAQTEMTASDGRVVVGAEKLQVARVLATDQVQKLRIASLQTVATTEQLVVAFQQATGVGLRFGLSLDQIRVLTVQLSQAAGALGVPLNQMSEEIRSLLTGTITPRNTRIATALGITNQQIRAAQKAGDLFQFVTKRLEAFSVAGEETAKTFSGVMSNIKEALQNFSGDITKPLFDSIRVGGQAALEDVFDLKNARISSKFAGILDVGKEVFAGLGDLLSGALNAGVKGAEQFSAWLKDNALQMDQIFRSTQMVAAELGGIVAELASLLPGLVDAGVKLNIFRNILLGAGLIFADIHTVVQVLITVFASLGAVILHAIIEPVIGWLRIVSRIAGIFNKDIANSIDNAANRADDFLKGIRAGISDYSQNLEKGNTATEKFIAKMDGMEAASTKAVAAAGRLESSLQRITNAELQNKKETEAALSSKAITQEQYAEKVRLIELETVKQKLAVQKIFLASIPFEEEGNRRRTASVISELKKQQSALSKGVKLKSIAEPPDTSKEDLEAGRGAESAITIEAKKTLSIRLRDLKIALDSQLISYKQYYDGVTQANAEALDKQIKAQETLLAVTTKPGARQKILAQIKAFNDEKAQIGQDSDEKRREAEIKLQEEVTKAHITLLKDEGKFSEARALEVNKQFQLLIAKLKAEGDEAGIAIVTKLFNIDNAKARLEEMLKSSKSIQDTLAARMVEINQLSEDHALNEAETRQEIVKAYTRAKEALEAMLPAMREAALLTGDENQIRTVEALAEKIREMGTTIRQTADDFKKLKDGGRDALQTGLAQFINDAATGAKDLGTAFRDAARSIIDSLRQIAAQMLANLIIQESLKFFGFAGGGSVSAATSTYSGGTSSGGVLAASGGYIRGPGSSRSDSIPAWLSNGEYVIQASAVRAVGVDLLDSINQTPRNRSRTRKYADGGLVAPAPDASNHSLSVGLEDGLVMRHLESSDGQRTVLKVLEKNSSKINRLLGR